MTEPQPGLTGIVVQMKCSSPSGAAASKWVPALRKEAGEAHRQAKVSSRALLVDGGTLGEKPVEHAE